MSIFSTEDAALHAAAVKAGLRTAAQAARGAGAALVASIGASLLGVDWLVVAGAAGVGAITVAWAGLDAYLGWISNGIPKQYENAVIESLPDAIVEPYEP